MKKFFTLHKINAKRRRDIMLFEQKDSENFQDAWSKFKCMVKYQNGIPECVFMEVFYFRLNKEAQQIVDVVLVGRMSRSSYNHIKETLDFMAELFKKLGCFYFWFGFSNFSYMWSNSNLGNSSQSMIFACKMLTISFCIT